MGTHSFTPNGPGLTAYDPGQGLGVDVECNHDKGALITLAAQGAGTVNGADQSNPSCRGVKVVVDISAQGGTPTTTVKIQGKDKASGKYFDLLTSAALGAVATTVLTLYPGVTTAANVAVSDVLPDTWRVIATVAGSTPSVTATIAAHPIL